MFDPISAHHGPHKAVWLWSGSLLATSQIHRNSSKGEREREREREKGGTEAGSPALNTAERNRRYRTLRTLQLTKQITLNQRTPISPPVSVCQNRYNGFHYPSADAFWTWTQPSLSLSLSHTHTLSLYDKYRNPPVGRCLFLWSITAHPFLPWPRSFAELVSDGRVCYHGVAMHLTRKDRARWARDIEVSTCRRS